MAYLGRGLDKISNIEVLDNITFDGSSSYSITKGSVAFTPNSAQSCLISIDGVVQATNFTVSSSTIDFGVAVPSTSICNFFLHYGTGVMTVPSDGSVTTAKLGDNSVTTAKINDGAITSAKINSSVGLGITMADNWRLTVEFTGNAHPISSNLERNDTAPALSYLGSQMTQSSGVFTFPSTGIYYVTYNASFKLNGDDRVFTAIIQATTDNSTYANASEASSHIKRTNNNETYQHIYTDALFDITDTSNQKVKFRINAGSSVETMANTTRDLTAMRFIRLGDTWWQIENG